MHIRKGDQVEVISGKDKGKRGRVLRVVRDKERVIVEGVNMVKKHARPNPRLGVKGGILEREAPLHASNLQPIDPQTGKPTRVGHKLLPPVDGKRKKIRIARRSGAELDR
jgi:large subunit ribosomal protein L24